MFHAVVNALPHTVSVPPRPWHVFWRPVLPEA